MSLVYSLPRSNSRDRYLDLDYASGRRWNQEPARGSLNNVYQIADDLPVKLTTARSGELIDSGSLRRKSIERERELREERIRRGSESRRCSSERQISWEYVPSNRDHHQSYESKGRQTNNESGSRGRQTDGGDQWEIYERKAREPMRDCWNTADMRSHEAYREPSNHYARDDYGGRDEFDEKRFERRSSHRRSTNDISQHHSSSVRYPKEELHGNRNPLSRVGSDAYKSLRNLSNYPPDKYSTRHSFTGARTGSNSEHFSHRPASFSQSSRNDYEASTWLERQKRRLQAKHVEQQRQSLMNLTSLHEAEASNLSRGREGRESGARRSNSSTDQETMIRFRFRSLPRNESEEQERLRKFNNNMHRYDLNDTNITNNKDISVNRVKSKRYNDGHNSITSDLHYGVNLDKYEILPRNERRTSARSVEHRTNVRHDSPVKIEAISQKCQDARRDYLLQDFHSLERSSTLGRIQNFARNDSLIGLTQSQSLTNLKRDSSNPAAPKGPFPEKTFTIKPESLTRLPGSYTAQPARYTENNFRAASNGQLNSNKVENYTLEMRKPKPNVAYSNSSDYMNPNLILPDNKNLQAYSKPSLYEPLQYNSGNVATNTSDRPRPMPSNKNQVNYDKGECKIIGRSLNQNLSVSDHRNSAQSQTSLMSEPIEVSIAAKPTLLEAPQSEGEITAVKANVYRSKPVSHNESQGIIDKRDYKLVGGKLIRSSNLNNSRNSTSQTNLMSAEPKTASMPSNNSLPEPLRFDQRNTENSEFNRDMRSSKHESEGSTDKRDYKIVGGKLIRSSNYNDNKHGSANQNNLMMAAPKDVSMEMKSFSAEPLQYEGDYSNVTRSMSGAEKVDGHDKREYKVVSGKLIRSSNVNDDKLDSTTRSNLTMTNSKDSSMRIEPRSSMASQQRSNTAVNAELNRPVPMSPNERRASHGGREYKVVAEKLIRCSNNGKYNAMNQTSDQTNSTGTYDSNKQRAQHQYDITNADKRQLMENVTVIADDSSSRSTAIEADFNSLSKIPKTSSVSNSNKYEPSEYGSKISVTVSNDSGKGEEEIYWNQANTNQNVNVTVGGNADNYKNLGARKVESTNDPYKVNLSSNSASTVPQTWPEQNPNSISSNRTYSSSMRTLSKNESIERERALAELEPFLKEFTTWIVTDPSAVKQNQTIIQSRHSLNSSQKRTEKQFKPEIGHSLRNRSIQLQKTHSDNANTKLSPAQPVRVIDLRAMHQQRQATLGNSKVKSATENQFNEARTGYDYEELRNRPQVESSNADIQNRSATKTSFSPPQGSAVIGPEAGYHHSSMLERNDQLRVNPSQQNISGANMVNSIPVTDQASKLMRDGESEYVSAFNRPTGVTSAPRVMSSCGVVDPDLNHPVQDSRSGIVPKRGELATTNNFHGVNLVQAPGLSNSPKPTSSNFGNSGNFSTNKPKSSVNMVHASGLAREPSLETAQAATNLQKGDNLSTNKVRSSVNMVQAPGLAHSPKPELLVTAENFQQRENLPTNVTRSSVNLVQAPGLAHSPKPEKYATAEKFEQSGNQPVPKARKARCSVNLVHAPGLAHSPKPETAVTAEKLQQSGNFDQNNNVRPAINLVNASGLAHADKLEVPSYYIQPERSEILRSKNPENSAANLEQSGKYPTNQVRSSVNLVNAPGLAHSPEPEPYITAENFQKRETVPTNVMRSSVNLVHAPGLAHSPKPEVYATADKLEQSENYPVPKARKARVSVNMVHAPGLAHSPSLEAASAAARLKQTENNSTNRMRSLNLVNAPGLSHSPTPEKLHQDENFPLRRSAVNIVQAPGLAHSPNLEASTTAARLENNGSINRVRSSVNLVHASGLAHSPKPETFVTAEKLQQNGNFDHNNNFRSGVSMGHAPGLSYANEISSHSVQPERSDIMRNSTNRQNVNLVHAPGLSYGENKEFPLTAAKLETNQQPPNSNITRHAVNLVHAPGLGNAGYTDNASSATEHHSANVLRPLPNNFSDDRYSNETINGHPTLPDYGFIPARFSTPSISVDRSSGGSLWSSNDGIEAALLGYITEKSIRDTYTLWYKPNMPRDEIVSTLKQMEPGSFIVRDSSSYPGSFALAVKVAEVPLNAPSRGKPSDDDLVRHFLIETNDEGVRLKGYKSEPVFETLASLIYQHTHTPIALPCKLLPPLPVPVSSQINGSHQEHQISAAILNYEVAVLYLHSQDSGTSTGADAVYRTVSSALNSASCLMVHLTVSNDGLTITDSSRKLFYRRHYPLQLISYCGYDPAQRRFTGTLSENHKELRIFGFVSRKMNSPMYSECHVFAELNPAQCSAMIADISRVLGR